ncbi:hypothetical protein BZA77DRAFT_251030, partial [Pyronema omphalodes]
TQHQRDMNKKMSAVRIGVKHSFGMIMMLWSFDGLKNKLKVGLSPIAGYFMISVLLPNIHTCYNGSQTSTKFNCAPPSVEDYLYLRSQCRPVKLRRKKNIYFPTTSRRIC